MVLSSDSKASLVAALITVSGLIAACSSQPSGGSVASGGNSGADSGTSGSSGHGGAGAVTGASGASGASGIVGASGFSGTGGASGSSGSTGTAGGGGASGAAGTSGAAGAPSGPYKWGAVALGGGGYVSGVVASLTEKNVFFARTDVGGMYRWDQAGARWLPLTNFVSEAQLGYLGVEAIAVDPQMPGKLYALVGTSYFNGGSTAILRSSDDGNTFQITDVTSQFKAHGNGMGRQNGERLAVDPNLGSLLLCGTRRNGLFKSSDSGATWSNVASFPVTTTANDNGVAFVVFDKSSSTNGSATSRIFAGVSRLGAANLYVSTNGGSSWDPVSGAPPTSQMPQRAVIGSNGALYVTYANGAGPNGNGGSEPMDTGSIWKYAISQGTWTNVTPAGATSAFSGISVDAADANHLVATTINIYAQQPWGYGDHIYVSNNGGTSWTDLFASNKASMDSNGMPWIANHAIHWAGTALFDPSNSDRVFVTSGNGVFATENLSAASSTWKFMAKGLEETVALEAVSVPGGPFGVAIGDYDGFLSNDVTVSPPNGIYAPSMGTTGSLALAGANPAVLVRAGSRLYRTANGGGSWTEVPRPNTQTQGMVALSADGNVLLWTPDGSNTCYRTANAGGAWAPVNGIGFGGGLVADPVNASKFYAYDGGSGNFLVSTDGGASFTQASKPGGGGADKPRAVPGVEGDIWLPLNGGGLSRSTNSGMSFSKIANVAQCSAVGFGKAAPGQTFPTVFIWGRAGGGSVTGIYRSLDAGASWQRVNDDQHQFGGLGNGHFIVGDLNRFGRVYMSTVGLGVVYGDPS